MGITTFDTLKYVRRLEQVGVSSEQAEAQAEVLTEAFNVNLEELVTKDYLAARFAEERAYMDMRFAQIDAKFTGQFWISSIIAAGVLIPLFERIV